MENQGLSLTEARKGDRAKMAAIVQALAVECGAAATIAPHIYSARAISVRIEAARGVRLSVDFRGDTPQTRHDIYVLSWHMELDTDARFSNAFGNINTFHFRKSTDIADSFGQLQSILRHRLGQIASGEAFDAAREAAGIAKDGTWQERKARFAAYRSEATAQT